MKLDGKPVIGLTMNRKNRMKKWLEQFENDMAAASFAEAGELDAAREMMKEDRRILLAVSDEKNDANALKYALNMCKRISAALEILLPAKAGRRAIENFLKELKKEKIEHRIIEVTACFKDEILSYTSKRRDILFVVIESSDGLDIHCEEDRRKISDAWSQLKCPLVVVSDLASA
jgi:adenosine/AMP kinase